MKWEFFEREIRKTIATIESSCKHADYIFRGEPKRYPRPCSSTLWREYAFGDITGFVGETPKEFRDNLLKKIDLNKVQKQILSEAKEYCGDLRDDFEILSYLRHHGGLTNLIDFTANLHIALFFACSDCHEENGHLYIQNVDLAAAWVKYPKNINPRAMGQKSVFIQHPQGFLQPTKDIPVPKDIKYGLMEYLARYYDVSAKTVFYDLAGFIQNFSIRKSLGHAMQTGTRYGYERNHVGRKASARYDNLAIDTYERVKIYDPTMPLAYSGRAIALYNRGEFDAAIEEFTAAIDIFPSDENYWNRGLAHLGKKNYDKAITDFSKSLKIFPSPRRYVIRGDVFREMGQHGKAERDYASAWNGSDDDWSLKAGYMLAILKIRKKEYRVALSEINKVIRRDTKGFFARFESYCVRGVALSCLGRWKEAQTDFVKCQEKTHNVDLLLKRDFHVVSSFFEERSIDPPLCIRKILGMR